MNRTLLKAYILFNVLASGLFVHWDELRMVQVIPIALAVLYLTFSRATWLSDSLEFSYPRHWQLSEILIGLTVLSPLVLHLFLTWNQESPFEGDQHYHLFVSQTFSRFLIRSFYQANERLGYFGLAVALIMSLIGLYLCWRMRLFRRYKFIIVMLALFAISFFIAFAPAQLAKYPSVSYIMALPLNVLWTLSEWHSPLNALRLSNLSAVAFWIFVFRPIVLGKKPDLTVLAIGCFFLWQKDAIYYLTSSYLESWALIWILCGAECLVALPRSQKWLSLLCLGMSSMTKETGVFLIPFFAIDLCLKRKRAELLAIISAAFVAGVPFLTYYFIRQKMGGFRHYGGVDGTPMFAAEKFSEIGNRLAFQFGLHGALLFLALLALVFLLKNQTRENRLHLITIFSGSAFLYLFYFFDGPASLFYAGYSRYYLFWFVGMSCLIFPLMDDLLGKGMASLVRYSCFAILPFGLFSAAQLIATDLNTDDGRNSFEHYGVPVHFPIRRLLTQYQKKMPTLEKQRIAVLSPHTDFHPFTYAYPDLAPVFVLNSIPDYESQNCRCTSTQSTVLALFPTQAQLMTRVSSNIFYQRGIQPLRNSALFAEKCLIETRQFCATVLVEYGSNKEIWGILGSTGQIISAKVRSMR